MSADNQENNLSVDELSGEPKPADNEDFLDERLSTLQERYSYERLSDLSARRLGAVDTDERGTSERDLVELEFKQLYKRFPADDADLSRRRWTLGNDYQSLAPLTPEQRHRIKDCHLECSRNIDRASQDALEREDLDGPISRFSTWIIEFADAVTPVVILGGKG
jgi:hypothetical protein